MQYLASSFLSWRNLAVAERIWCLNTLPAEGPNSMSAPDLFTISVNSLAVAALTTAFLWLWMGTDKFRLLAKGWMYANQQTKQTNSMVWVRERTIPTERPPLVGEVIANFCG
jgi:hypothetical protein